MNKILPKIKTLLKTGFFHIFGASAINKVLAFLCNILLLHIISKPEYGVFTYAWNIYSIVILFSGLGITTGLLQLCSEHAGDEDYAMRASDYGTRFGLKINIILSAVLLGIGIFAPLKIESSRVILIATCLMPFVQLYFELMNINLRVKKLNSRFAKMQLINTAVFYGVSLTSAFVIREMGLVVGHYISWIASILVGMFIFKITLLSNKRESIGEDKKPLLKISIISMTNNSLSHLLYLLDVFVLGIVDPQERTLLLSFLFRRAHGKGGLDIIASASGVGDEVDFQLLARHFPVRLFLPDLHHADVDGKAAIEQFVVDDVLHDVVFILLTEIQPGIAQTDILEIIFERSVDVGFPLDVVADRFIDQKSVFQIFAISGDDPFRERNTALGLKGVREFQRIGE